MTGWEGKDFELVSLSKSGKMRENLPICVNLMSTVNR